MECEGVTVLRSISGFITLAQVLVIAVAVSDHRRSREELLNGEQVGAIAAIIDDTAFGKLILTI